jgi:hypothetical protein
MIFLNCLWLTSIDRGPLIYVEMDDFILVRNFPKSHSTRFFLKIGGVWMKFEMF